MSQKAGRLYSLGINLGLYSGFQDGFLECSHSGQEGWETTIRGQVKTLVNNLGLKGAFKGQTNL